jgi:hypothetical protein
VRRLALVLTLAAAIAAPAAWAAAITGTGRADRIAVQGNGVRDRVVCGGGRDVVTADLFDRIAPDCETVSRQLSRDPTTSRFYQHQTQVEPDSFAFGSTIVTVFQSGRTIGRGGAAAIGWATSPDAGTSWRRGFLELTTERASDPTVAYDAQHGTWLVGVLSVDADESRGIQVTRSADGMQWSPLANVADTDSADKEWIACDNWPTSPFRGRCYLSYLNERANRIETRWTGDGGVTWSGPALTSGGVPRNLAANGAIPVPRPDGSLVVGFLAAAARFGSFVGATHSTDGGVTFSDVVRIGDLAGQIRNVTNVRAAPLPSLDADASGRVYAVWHDCRFSLECRATDVVFASSPDGVTWSTPARVPVRNPNDPTDEFIPAIAADPAGRLAITYYSLKQDHCLQTDCPGVNVNLIQSPDGGATWGRPLRLSVQGMRLSWLADADTGRFVGDYVSTSWFDGRPVPVFSLASPPAADKSLRQAIYAATAVG